MSNFVTLEEAAKKLGVSTEQLVEMRSRGEIFGYRDGGSWKFKGEEIQRVAAEMYGDVLDEDPAGSSILSFEPDKSSPSNVSSGSVLGSSKSGSDVSLEVDPSSSDVRLAATSDLNLDIKKPNSGNGLSDVDESGLRLADSDDDDDEIAIVSGDDDGLDLDLNLGSDVGLGSDLKLSEDSGLIKGDSDPGIAAAASSGAGSDVNLDSDLEIEGDDLVLGSGSDLVLAADSGINLQSPADSGISLEEESLEVAGSGISGLELEIDAGGSGFGSGIDFQQDEEFQLSPSGAIDVTQDSGSQAIEIEDSADVGAADMDAFADVGAADDGGFESAGDFGEFAPSAGPVVPVVAEVPYSALQVSMLLLILLVLGLSGILVSDVVRNLWAWTPGNEGGFGSLTSGFTDMLVGK